MDIVKVVAAENTNLTSEVLHTLASRPVRRERAFIEGENVKCFFYDSALVQITSGSVSPTPRTTTEGGGFGPSQTSLAKLGPTTASMNTRK